ncbi:hypothetical protein VNI00_000702 [Paramarasmius palmivorus]|uniref:F-box domain-containing protein n=1 Tax=Paramarasmius palmivorus TaxID=297713 RepID=A0AAW0EBX9_9AGAR
MEQSSGQARVKEEAVRSIPELPAEILDRIFRLLLPYTLRRLRRVSKRFSCIATPIHFRKIQLPSGSPQRIIKFMRGVSACPHIADTIRELEVSFMDHHFMWGAPISTGAAFALMSNLVVLRLHHVPPKTCIHSVIGNISKTFYSSLREFEFDGPFIPEIQSFVEKHSSTLNILCLECYSQVCWKAPATPGPVFSALQRASGSLSVLRYLISRGASSLASIRVTDYSTIGALQRFFRKVPQLQDLEIYIDQEHETSIFQTVADVLPELISFSSVSLQSGESDSLNRFPAVIDIDEFFDGCAGLTKLRRLKWVSNTGEYGNWSVGLPVVLELSRNNPNLEFVALPDSGVWKRVEPDIWIPYYFDLKKMHRAGNCWLLKEIHERSYSCLPSLLSHVEASYSSLTQKLPETLLEDVVDLFKAGEYVVETDALNLLQLMAIVWNL